MPSNKPVRVAVVGCGVISELHLRCYAHNPAAKVVAVCDLVPERARRAAEERAPGARSSAARRARSGIKSQTATTFAAGLCA